MVLHIIGGFLGSGKTTAIVAAAKQLVSLNKKVGIITNDQGKYLVDTAFYRYENLPTVEVTGGCFCTNFDDFEAKFNEIREQVDPDVVFAEAIGTSPDIVASVVKPLHELNIAGVSIKSLTVFNDVRLLRHRIQGKLMPFSEHVLYIIDKQIDNADVLIINKIDLVSREESSEIEKIVQKEYPGKKIRMQNSRDENNIKGWIDLLDSLQTYTLGISPEIDYMKFGKGETSLSWMNEKIVLDVSGRNGRDVVIGVLGSIIEAVLENGCGIGHLKFLIGDKFHEIKTGITFLENERWKNDIPDLFGDWITILINARIEAEPERLQKIIQKSIKESADKMKIAFVESDCDVFRPRMPEPSRRIS